MKKLLFYVIRTLSVFLLLSVTVVPSWVYAHGGATGVVKERMDAMSAMGDAMEIMGDMVKGKRPFESSAFLEGAKAVIDHSAKITVLFPEGSLSAKSEALPKLWTEWDQFVVMVKRTEKEADKLAALAENGSDSRALKKQFVKLGKSCKSCHTDYRKKKKEEH
ncbi:cytochrome c [Motiliproteus sp. MSK22-1]|uniref:c-type cytochrome n=1 Tax=Motiliproteus sp. MSK22-1 TaxID=1897630 RepID=UPI00097557A0|nr:cytochrome c [Motiliproteus sp. MSK22-1]OMH31755.1 hypothetical protein BGP75_16685 [Motiliproteus sp. MSK22-1]